MDQKQAFVLRIIQEGVLIGVCPWQKCNRKALKILPLFKWMKGNIPGQTRI
jgi:hypothetical protein